MITVTLGNGATIADGDKIWVNFPSSAGNWPSYKLLDTTNPQLNAVYLIEDIDNDEAAASIGDSLLFVFSEAIDQSTITSANVAEKIILSAGTLDTGFDPQLNWIGKDLRVTLTNAQTD